MDIRPSKISSKSSFQNLGLLGLITAALTVLSVIYLLSHQATAFSRNKETHPKISVSALIDKNNTILARKSLSALNFDTFTPITSVPNFGYTPHPVWLKLTVDNPKGEPLVLKINNPLLDSIRVYQQSPQDQRWSLTHHLGSKRTKNIAHRFFHIDLSTSLINKQTTILLRIQSRDNMLVAPLAILNQASLIEDTNTESITNGLYYGIVAIMLIYNLLLWLFLRERVYLLYSFFISTFALLQLSSDGYLLLWITHNFGNWKTWFNAFAADLSAVAMLVYARAFLDIRKYGPIWDQLAISLATIAVIAAIMVPLGRYEIMLNIASLINAASAPLLIGMGITAYRQGYTPARFFIVGYSVLLITIIFVSYAMMGGASANLWNDWNLENVMKLGAAIEIAFFSFALAERINAIYQNNQNIQKSLLIAEIQRRESQELSLRLAAKIEQSEAIARMTQTLAHDVRKPFSLLKIGLDRLNFIGSDLKENRIIVQKIHEHVSEAFEHVNGMIADILEVSTHKNAIKTEKIDFIKILSAALNQVFCREKGPLINFQYELHSRTTLIVDEKKILRVLVNILENARQGMQNDGTIWVTSTLGPDSNQSNWMIITIANSGSFIPQETIKDIFEAFYTNGKRGGTGLGLTISKKIILDHGGDITCRSAPETGTEFSFTLPAGEKDISPLQELSQSKDTLPKDSHEIRARFEASLHHRAG